MAELRIEESLKRIADNLESMPDFVKAVTKILEALSTTNASNLNALKNIVEKAKKGSEAAKEAAKEISDKLDKIAEEVGEEIEREDLTKRKLEDARQRLGKTLVDYTLGMRHLNSGLSDFLEELSDLPAVGAVFGMAAFATKQVEDVIDSFSTLTRAGIVLRDGIGGLFDISGRLGLTIEETAQVLAENNILIQRIGARDFVDFVKIVRTGNENLTHLGLTYQDLISYSTEYLTVRRNLEGIQKIRFEEDESLLARTVREFYAASQMFGHNMDEFFETFKRMSEDPRTRVALRALPEEGRMLLAVIEESSPMLSEYLKEAILKGAVERIEEYGTLQAAGMAETLRFLFEAVRKGADPREVVEFLKNRSLEFEKRAEYFFRIGQDRMAQVMSEMAILSNRIVANVQETRDRVAGDRKTLFENLSEIRVGITNLISEIRQKALEFASSFLKEGSVFRDVVVNVLSGLNTLLSSEGLVKSLDYLVKAIERLTTHIIKAIELVSLIPSKIFGVSTPVGAAILAGSLYFYNRLLKDTFVDKALRTGIASLLDKVGLRFLRLIGGKLARLSKFGKASLLVGGYLGYEYFFGGAEEKKPIAPPPAEIKPTPLPTPPAPAAPTTSGISEENITRSMKAAAEPAIKAIPKPVTQMNIDSPELKALKTSIQVVKEKIDELERRYRNLDEGMKKAAKADEELQRLIDRAVVLENRLLRQEEEQQNIIGQASRR